MQVGLQPISIGWILGLLVLVLAIIFALIGVPDPKVVLLLIGLLGLARLL
jgi:hypothetical protein